jgi:hypothetical protein
MVMIPMAMVIHQVLMAAIHIMEEAEEPLRVTQEDLHHHLLPAQHNNNKTTDQLQHKKQKTLSEETDKKLKPRFGAFSLAYITKNFQHTLC